MGTKKKRLISMKEDIEKGKRQAEEFKARYGEYPSLPVRIRYVWVHTRCEGDLKLTRFGDYAIFGFPGVIGVGDDEVHDVVFLHDAKGRQFPNISK